MQDSKIAFPLLDYSELVCIDKETYHSLTNLYIVSNPDFIENSKGVDLQKLTAK